MTAIVSQKNKSVRCNIITWQFNLATLPSNKLNEPSPGNKGFRNDASFALIFPLNILIITHFALKVSIAKLFVKVKISNLDENCIHTKKLNI